MSSRRIKTLVIPAGAGTSITAIKALRQDDDIIVIAADVDRLAPGLYLSHKGFLLPPFSDEGFFDELKALVREEGINVIIPALDTILLSFSNKVDEFRDIGVQILVSEPETIRVTRDKWETYLHLRDTVTMPKSFIVKREADGQYPLFIKPRDGSGSQQAYTVKTPKELDFFFDYVRSPIIQEYLPGAEYTVDCIADMEGNLIACVPRRRFEIQDGITTKTLIVRNARLEEMGLAISEKLKFRGPFFFQAREDRDSRPRLIEVNSRVAGTMCHKSFQEGNFHSLAVKLAMGKKMMPPRIKYGFYITRYWEEIYLNENGSGSRYGEPAARPVKRR